MYQQQLCFPPSRHINNLSLIRLLKIDEFTEYTRVLLFAWLLLGMLAKVYKSSHQSPRDLEKDRARGRGRQAGVPQAVSSIYVGPHF